MRLRYECQGGRPGASTSSIRRARPLQACTSDVQCRTTEMCLVNSCCGKNICVESQSCVAREVRSLRVRDRMET